VSVAASALPQDAWTSALSQCTTTVHQLTAGAATYEYVLLMPPAAANGAKTQKTPAQRVTLSLCFRRGIQY
jgi:hypothetical protein